MISIIETIKGDDIVKRFNEFYDSVKDNNTINITKDGISVYIHKFEAPAGGTMDGEPFISDCVVKGAVITNKLNPQIGTESMNLFGEKLREMGGADFPFVLSIDSFSYKDSETGLYLSNDDLFPVEVLNHLKFDHPTLSSVLLGMYDIEIPQTDVMNLSDDIKTHLKSKIKKAKVFYELYKKGTIDGVSYELGTDPLFSVTSDTNYKHISGQHNLHPAITIAWGLTVNGERVHRLPEDLETTLKEKFKKHGIRLQM